MKSFYSDFVGHCVRFYLRYPNPVFQTTADRLNWRACQIAVKQLDCDEFNIMTEIYNDRDTLADNVYKYSTKHSISQDKIWNTISKIERIIATCRGLI